MAKIRIEGYRRSGYTMKRRGRRIRISGTTVKGYLRKDVGKKGRTRKAKRWFKRRGVTLGKYKISQKTRTRHMYLRKADKRHGSIKTFHRLRGLANVQAYKTAKKTLNRDARWFKKKFLSKKERRRMTAKARRAR